MSYLFPIVDVSTISLQKKPSEINRQVLEAVAKLLKIVFANSGRVMSQTMASIMKINT
jgi:hypothetical protein